MRVVEVACTIGLQEIRKASNLLPTAVVRACWPSPYRVTRGYQTLRHDVKTAITNDSELILLAPVLFPCVIVRRPLIPVLTSAAVGGNHKGIILSRPVRSGSLWTGGRSLTEARRRRKFFGALTGT